ncbi:putative mitochondrial folate/biopterin transporter [Leptomonas pyrrhocoris]|uniref:Putative mitochondrial folate/biopterin transporter n=1 Tax=Leptomonas pyrrhocoris TaxID=157538 RepID=A0A0M9G669_LEPPY|nr:putative mitochondrial folate/biopterin transporter [Leptomonas pyrrhocoris]KPA83187.1 putative mitochondrial folate/biopterin transporter [Leptomonas pyrrhocoris]|eukprot:XP_015661626.1 putative mitochondrial folate/biopterin transporter [Leptomonas pyrrhocoris]
MPSNREDPAPHEGTAITTPQRTDVPLLRHRRRNDVAPEEVDENSYVDPEAAAMYSAAPWMQHIPLASEAMTGYGPRPVFSLGVCYFFNKGLANQLMNSATYAMLINRFKMPPERYNRLGSMGTLGWSLNAFTAMMCDTFALMGYTKRWYMFISSLLSGVLTIIYAVLPARPSSADTAAAFIFLASFGRANVDILSEGYYTRKMRQHPKPGPALVSYIWCASMAGTIISSAINGPVSDKGVPQVNIYIAGAVQTVISVIFAVNWYQEGRNTEEREEDAYVLFKEELLLREGCVADDDSGANEQEMVGGADGSAHILLGDCSHESREGKLTTCPEHVEGEEGDVNHISDEDERRATQGFVYENPPRRFCCGFIELNSQVIGENWRIFVYSCVMTAAVLAETVGTIFADTLGLLLILVIVSTVCCATSFWALQRTIAMANVFGYLAVMVDITVWGPMYNFYVATEKCLPDGPHFSYTFYTTIGPIVGNIAGIVGVNAFNYIFRTQRYRLVFVLTTFVNIFGNIFDIIIVKRWNTHIGIPDHAMYLFGNAVVYDVCYMIAWMPMIVLISRLCPRGSESMVFAIMSGFRTIGQTTAAQIGTVILEFGWNVPACDFTNLPMVLLVCRVLSPLLVIPLVFLVPNARICDDLDIDGHILQAKIDDADLLAREAVSSTTDTEEKDLAKKGK